MPIKPENRERYPANWKEIREMALLRAGNRCENCDVPNGGWRNNETGETTASSQLAGRWAMRGDCAVTKIVLTIAHLDHQPENCEPANLRAWCQRCHLAYDAEHHRVNASRTRELKQAAGTPALPGMGEQ